MKKGFWGKLLGVTLAASMVFTSSIPAAAAEGSFLTEELLEEESFSEENSFDESLVEESFEEDAVSEETADDELPAEDAEFEDDSLDETFEASDVTGNDSDVTGNDSDEPQEPEKPEEPTQPTEYQWKNKEYTVIYHAGYGKKDEKKTVKYTYDKREQELFTGFKKTGYEFAEWTTAKNAEDEIDFTYCEGSEVGTLIEEYADHVGVTKIDLYACWAAIEYHVVLEGLTEAIEDSGLYEFNPNEGLELYYGETLDLAEYNYEWKGYTLKGWKLGTGKKAKVFKPTDKVKNLTSKNGDVVTLTAQWTENTNKITYKLGGGKQKKAPTTYKRSKGAALKAPTKKGYYFDHWKITRGGVVLEDAELDEVYDAINNKIKVGAYGNLVLTAVYKPFTYSFIFHVDGVEEPIRVAEYNNVGYPDKITFNDAADEITHDLKLEKGKQVVGFAKKKGGKLAYNREKTYSKFTLKNKEIHLYAIIKSKTYSISYEGEYDGFYTITKPVHTYTAGKGATLPKANAKGYTFKGWFVSDPLHASHFVNGKKVNGETSVTAIKKTATENVTVYPEFEPIKYKLYIAPNASGVYKYGSFEEDEEKENRIPVKSKLYAGKFDYEGVCVAEGNIDPDEIGEDLFYRDGYRLAGFSTNPKAKTPSVSIDDVRFEGLTTKSSVTLYAIWEPNEFSISYAGAIAVLKSGDYEPLDESDVSFEDLPETVRFGKALTLPKLESTEDYKFLGWIANDPDRVNSFTYKNGYVIKINAKNSSDVELCAVFKKLYN